MAGRVMSALRNYFAKRRTVSKQREMAAAKGGLPEFIRNQTALLEHGAVEQRRAAAVRLHSRILGLSPKDAAELSRTLKRLIAKEKDTPTEAVIGKIIGRLDSRQ